jgi:hypothetical protein
MDQGRRLKRMTRALSKDVVAGQALQLRVDQRDQLIESFLISFRELKQERRNGTIVIHLKKVYVRTRMRQGRWLSNFFLDWPREFSQIPRFTGEAEIRPPKGKITMTTKTTQNQQGMQIRSNAKAGSITLNHNQQGMVVRSKAKAGALIGNHNQQGMVVRSKAKAGALTSNHNQKAV